MADMTACEAPHARRLEAIIEATGAGTWEWNVRTGENFINARWAEMLGYTRDELTPRDSICHWRKLAHPADLLMSDAAFEAYFSGRTQCYECIVRMRHKSGHWVWVHDRGRIVSRTDSGDPEWIVGTHIDISRAQESQHILGRLAHSIPGIVYVFSSDAHGRYSFPYISEKTTEFFGLTPEQVREDPQRLFGLVHAEDLQGLMCSIEESRQQMSAWQYQYRIERDGRTSWMQGIAEPERDDDGATVWYGILTNIDGQKALESRLRQLSVTDELTGLYNRRQLLAELQSQFDLTLRYKQPVAVALIDIDHFKTINDGYGHPAGDMVLKRFAELLRTRLRRTDIYGRFGGEEFLVIFPQQTLSQARAALDELRRTFRAQTHITLQGARFHASFSAGLALIGESDGNPSQLLSRVDQALYQAKSRGRDTCVVADT